MVEAKIPPETKSSAPWVTLGAVLLILSCIFGINRSLEHDRIGGRENERLSTQAKVVQLNLAWNLNAVNKVLVALQKERSRPAGAGDLELRLKALTDAMSGVRTLAILDAGGAVLVSNRPELVGKNFKERDYFRTPRLHPDPDTLYLSSPFQSSLGVFVFTLGRAVVGPRGEFAGVVVATLDPEYFRTLLSSVLYAPDMCASVAHGDGTLFMLVPERQEASAGEPVTPGASFLGQRAGGPDSGRYLGIADLPGERRMFVWRTLQPPGLKMDRPLMVAVSRNPAKVYRSWRNETLMRGAVLALIVFGSSLGLHRFRKRQRQFDLQSAESAAALKATTERLYLATEAAGIGVWELDLASGRVTWNDTMYAMYGLAKETVLSHETWLACLHPEDLAAVERSMQARIRQGLPLDDEFRIVRPDGATRSVRGMAQVDCDAQGRPLRVVGVCFDVTERNEAEARMVEAKQLAEAANRAKSAFLANMSHEIRTPMNAILGLIYLLQKTGLNPRQWDYVDKVRGAATSLLDILNDILDFSKVESGRMELEQVPFRLDDLLRNLSVILSANSRDKDIEVLFSVAPEVPCALVGDPLRLQQVLINLAGNAVKFTDRGEVVLCVSLAEASAGRVALTISIRDTGIGIDEENLDRIFEGFTQAEISTSRRFGGTGLGLAISSRLVRLMGGEIELTSEPGKGSRFSFTVSFELQQGDAQRSSAPVLPAGRALRVLIADDCLTARQVLSEMARSIGWSADLAEDGDRALALFQKALAAGERYDAVFVDWRMPGIDGFETSHRIRELCQGDSIPVVVMVTPYGREAMAEVAQKEPGLIDAFLMKPVTGSMLVDALAEATHGFAPLPAAPGGETRRRFAGVRILLVEDNKVNQLVAREILEGEGAQVVVADNGLEAVERLSLRQESFDAVLMDVQMPVMDGYQATREIREGLGEKTLPIIAMTANAFSGDRQRALDAGLNDHLSKPIDVEKLVETLGRYCQLNRSQPLAIADPCPGRSLTPHSEIAPLPGLDLSATLKRLNGNRALYGQIAGMVCTKHADAGEQLARLLSLGDADGARRQLHTLKGVVINMGAVALGESIQVLEARLKEGAAADDLAEPLAGFHALLAEAIGSLTVVAERFGERKTQREGDADGSGNRE
jgi:PAS domain S-box-containing protein